MYRKLIIILLLSPSVVCAQQINSSEVHRETIENGLLPAVVIESELHDYFSIYERMDFYNVPGVSVAVIRNGEIDWVAAYGTTQAGSSDSVTVSTLFQTASLSKPVAAFGALRLVEAGFFTLDDDVNQWLKSWQIPAGSYTQNQPVTLRHLLSHTAGLNVHGFPGYGQYDEVPASVDILNGNGNTEAVMVSTIPGTEYRYSGGGYTIAQVLIEDVTGQAFSEVMQHYVLAPLGMELSTFDQLHLSGLEVEAASGHYETGTLLQGNWHHHPEQAAAGLWSTPEEISRFVLGVRAAWLGQDNSTISRENAREMLTAQEGGHGLGPMLYGSDENFEFLHTGANVGYRSVFLLYPEAGNGVVVMSNADSGGELNMEIVRAVSHVYNWPNHQPRVINKAELNTGDLNRLTGKYQFSSAPDHSLLITREDDHLLLTLPDIMGSLSFHLIPVSKTVFLIKETGTPINFAPAIGNGELEFSGLRARRE